MPTFLAHALSDKTLYSAWQRVQVNAGGPGADGVTIEQFNDEIEVRLRRLRKQVIDGRYVPQPLRRVAMHRAGRRPRLLAIPSVRDRVLQTAVALVLGPALEKTFGNSSFGYRPGRCVTDAVEHVIAGRERGFHWAVDADIHAFFDHVPHAQLIERLSERISDPSLTPLITQWLATPVIEDGQPIKLETGIAQGSPLSPLLSNLYLDGFDRCIANPQQWLVRYADDFLILCKHYDAAEHALEQASRWLSDHGLEIAYDKTRITRFRDGFDFLGVHFEADRVWACDPEAEPWVLPRRLRGRHVPASPTPAATATAPIRKHASPSGVATPAAQRTPNKPAQAKPSHTPSAAASPDVKNNPADRSPLLRTLHLCEHGNYIHRRAGRLVVGHGDEDRLEVPMADLDQVSASAEGAISFGALRGMLEHGVGFVLNGRGGPIGWLAGADLGHLELQRAQFKRIDQAGFRLDTARALVQGKITNSRVLLRRYLRLRADRDNGALDQLAALQRGLEHATGVDAVRGFEGQAAKVYFDALARLLAPNWSFESRNRRPPLDPVNALLSYGYAVLFQNTLTLIVRRGLNPCVGVLHGLRDGHASLASDLMEEFRPLVVDAVVLRMLLGGDFKPHDFENGGPDLPCRIGHAAKRRFIQALEKKLDHPLTHPATGQVVDFRRAIESQVALYADVLSGRVPRYQAFIQR
ncbi:MAG: CRISPR-associated endonuclease Cas1 [Thauera sp.]|jgi:CRISPR-associated protein Cas1|nr:CRISPR-associated endonuclease Cas1 [Thauera sp.]